MPAELVVREASPSDRPAIAFSLAHLGDQSRYQRFLVAHPAVATEVARLTAIDHWHHEVLVAFSTAPRVPIGIGEYVRLDDFDVAELAISVNDGWQHQGVGATLVRELRERALVAGIRHFRATMLRGNRGALALAKALGPCTKLGAAGSLIELLIDL
jgi:RimJ/RimL family protein N-acetyltransferase